MALAALFLLVAVVSAEDVRIRQTLSSMMGNFDDFVTAYKRPYSRDSPEYHQRRTLFEQRTMEIALHNARAERLWNAGVNHLTDRTHEEFQQLLGRRGPRSSSSGGGKGASLIETQAIAESVDWTTNLTTFKTIPDQGQCGSCWAVTSASLLEARFEIANQRHRSFAAQQLVNCVPNPKACGGSGGCGGATVELAMKYVKKHGLHTNKAVPYKGEDDKCASDSSLMEGVGHGEEVGLVSYKTLEENKAEPLMRSLMEGPVAISVGANDWQSYVDGVFDGCAVDTVINHAVLAAGYGVDSETKTNYWLIRNSWGDGWGEKGYIRLHRNDTIKANDKHCGTDNKPEEGVACKPYPKKIKVCGMCGMLYDSVSTEHQAVAAKSPSPAPEPEKAQEKQKVQPKAAETTNDDMTDATAPLPAMMAGSTVKAEVRRKDLIRKESYSTIVRDQRVESNDHSSM